MQKFLEDNLSSRYIKALLYNTYLPTYRTVRKNDYVISGILYIYRESIIRVSSSGYLDPTNSSLSPKASYKYIDNYYFGEYRPKFSSNFISRNNYYDSDTHIRLGKYLRCYRDIMGIDLMPFYNCYCNKYINKENITLTSDGIFEGYIGDTKYEILEIPIKFNQEYTIAIDSPSTVTMVPCFMSGDDFISISKQNISEGLWENKQNIVVYPSMIFSNPVIYKISNSDPYFQNFEKNLTLLIQLPFGIKTSVVVLEGNYADKSRQIIDISSIGYIDDVDLDKYFTYRPSLLKMNDKIRYAFSDRIVEFLLGNVIAKNEDIVNNVKRVQDAIKANSYFESMDDVWNDNLRKLLFDSYLDYADNPYDVTGYVDKDIEKFLRKA